MKQLTISILFSVLLLTSISCQTGRKDKSSAIDPLASHIDSSYQAGDDFFDYANGKWFKANPIAASEQSSGIWQLIQDTINSQILKICKTSAKTISEKGSNKQKIGDFYFSGMDSANLNKTGISCYSEIPRSD